jgi:hypothetical protein
MNKRILSRWLLTFCILIGVTLIWCAVSTSRVSADCSVPPKSSCISCHAPDGHVIAMGEWNKVHLNQDMCISCHGGNGSTMDKSLAHDGMVAQPLSDIYTDCHSCHPTDYQARSNQLAATLNVTPESCATPTAVAVYAGSGGSQTGNISMSLNTTTGVSTWKSFLLITGILASLAIFLLGLSWLNNHRVKS